MQTYLVGLLQYIAMQVQVTIAAVCVALPHSSNVRLPKESTNFVLKTFQQMPHRVTSNTNLHCSSPLFRYVEKFEKVCFKVPAQPM